MPRWSLQLAVRLVQWGGPHSLLDSTRLSLSSPASPQEAGARLDAYREHDEDGEDAEQGGERRGQARGHGMEQGPPDASAAGDHGEPHPSRRRGVPAPLLGPLHLCKALGAIRGPADAEGVEDGEADELQEPQATDVRDLILGKAALRRRHGDADVGKVGRKSPNCCGISGLGRRRARVGQETTGALRHWRTASMSIDSSRDGIMRRAMHCCGAAGDTRGGGPAGGCTSRGFGGRAAAAARKAGGRRAHGCNRSRSRGRGARVSIWLQRNPRVTSGAEAQWGNKDPRQLKRLKEKER